MPEPRLQEKTFREQVIERLIAALGKPEVARVEAGNLYRWTLNRGPATISMFVTIDSPEHPHIAHIIVSDGSAYQSQPVITSTVHTLEETDAIIAGILKQWKSFPRQAVH